jgi:DNA-binding transcriptional regulator YiaG
MKKHKNKSKPETKENENKKPKASRPLKVHHTRVHANGVGTKSRGGTATTGAHVTKIREVAGLSKRDFAALLDVTVGTIHTWESAGRKTIKADPTRRVLMTKLAGMRDGEVQAAVGLAQIAAKKHGVLAGFGKLAVQVALA